MRNEYRGGENFDLRHILIQGRSLLLSDKLQMFDSFLQGLKARQEQLCMRQIVSAADREVKVIDPFDGAVRTMLMFGSNNYLGLANHPYVRQKVNEAISRYGIGIGGPPLLNGYSLLHRRLEERLADLKGTEDALIFSSGYGANVGLVAGLMNANDTVFYDTYSHASFCDGMKMAGSRSMHFRHNDVADLTTMLQKEHSPGHGDTYVGVEGVYSMDGDLSPLDKLVPLCRQNNALLILDDAHGTGVLGATGRGTAEHFGVEGQVPITMGTFSKVFAMTGGFIASSKSIVEYLRYFARPYMFSASLPPVTIASVLAGLDVLEKERELLVQLRANVRYFTNGLLERGFAIESQSPIIPLRVPTGMNIRRAAYQFHQQGIFVNSIEYPAVPLAQQRFRVSMMSTHTTGDIDRLLSAIDEVWGQSASDEMLSHHEEAA